jgi:hypothetical protein
MRDPICELVAEELEEGETPHSLTEGLGIIRLHLLRLELEMTRIEGEQDADRLLQELVGLAAAAMASGTAFVIPQLERGTP